MLEAGFLAARAEDVAEVVEAYLLGDVELDEDETEPWSVLSIVWHGRSLDRQLAGRLRGRWLRLATAAAMALKACFFGVHRFRLLSEGRDEKGKSRVKT